MGHSLGQSREDKKRVTPAQEQGPGSSGIPSQRLELGAVWKFLQGQLILCRGFAHTPQCPAPWLKRAASLLRRPQLAKQERLK